MREFIVWWVGIEAVGLAAFPLTYAFFGRLPDRGFAFCKVVGLLLLGYGLWAGAVAGLIPNSRGSVILILFLIAGLSLAVVGRRRREMAGFLRSGWRYMALVEAMFLVVLAAAVYIRSFAPDIVWGEKPFELAFLNAVNRSEFFPPGDPWLAGHSISYYYFGYVMVSALSKLVALGTEVTFYLSLSLMAALAWVAAFGLVYNMIAVSRRRGWVAAEGLSLAPRAIVFGLAGSFSIIIVSNLAGVFELMARHGIGSRGFYGLVGIWDLNGTYDCSAAPTYCSEWYPTQYWWWWKATRMGSAFDIQEFPFFSFQFGDLHPHVLLMPFLIVAFAVAFQVVLMARGRRPDEGGVPVQGGVGGWWLRRSWPAWIGAFAVGGAVLAAAIVAGAPVPVAAALTLLAGGAMWVLAAVSGSGGGGRRWPRAWLDARWWLRNPAAFVFMALLFGGVAFIDTWGVVITWLLLATAAAVANWLRSGSLPRTLLDTMGFALPLGVAAYVFYLPFYAELATPVKGLTVTEAAIAARVPLAVGGYAATSLPAVLGAGHLGGALVHRGERVGGAAGRAEAVRPCHGGRPLGGAGRRLGSRYPLAQRRRRPARRDIRAGRERHHGAHARRVHHGERGGVHPPAPNACLGTGPESAVRLPPGGIRLHHAAGRGVLLCQ